MSGTLIPELQPYVIRTEIGQMLQHPLFHQLYFGTEMEINMLNSAFPLKLKALEDAVTAGDWNTAIALHERPYRVDVLARVPRDVANYWELVADWWVDTEFPSHRLDTWIDILDHPDAHQMMNSTEREHFNSLPDRVTVYRGVQEDEDLDSPGISWTLDERTAQWFANRFSTNEGEVLVQVVPKSDITALLHRRSELEILILP